MAYLEIDQEPPEDDLPDDDPDLMSDQEFEDDLALAASGKWEELGLHGGVVPGYEKTPINEFLNG